MLNKIIFPRHSFIIERTIHLSSTYVNKINSLHNSYAVKCEVGVNVYSKRNQGGPRGEREDLDPHLRSMPGMAFKGKLVR